MPCSAEMEVEKILLNEEVAHLSNENKELVKQVDLLDKELQSKCPTNRS
jgi:D-ribose pyranose/furanose isomerase RbsD